MVSWTLKFDIFHIDNASRSFILELIDLFKKDFSVKSIYEKIFQINQI